MKVPERPGALRGPRRRIESAKSRRRKHEIISLSGSKLLTFTHWRIANLATTCIEIFTNFSGVILFAISFGKSIVVCPLLNY